MSRRNSIGSKRARRLERTFRDAAREAAVEEERRKWEELKPGQVVSSAVSAFLRSYDGVSDVVPMDALFTFVASGDVDVLEERLKEARKSGESFVEYVRMAPDSTAAEGGADGELLFVMTASVCGKENYRNVLRGCNACAFHSILDFFNSTFPFDRNSYGTEVMFAPEGRIVSSSVEVSVGDEYFRDFMEKAGIRRREHLMIEPWNFLFKKSGDGYLVPIVDVAEYNREAEKINSLMDEA